MKNKNKIIFLSLAILILAVVFFFARNQIDGIGNTAKIEEDKSGIVVVPGSGDVKVEVVPAEQKTGLKAPDLNRPIKYPSNMTEKVRKIFSERIDTNIADLKKDPGLLDSWLGLGLLYKAIEDYEGAREVWEYCAILSPNNATSFTNLGDLYGYYLKDKIRAEKNYLQAIENDKASVYLYVRAADFYREVMDDLEKARNILIKGISVIPNDPAITDALEKINILINEQKGAPKAM